VADEAIYESKVRFDALRLPFQTKADGTRRLNCIYRTDGKGVGEPIDTEHLFVHSNNTTDSSMVGNLLYLITNLFHLSDAEYSKRMQVDTTNEYVSTKCANTTQGVIMAVNNKSLIIEDEATILAILNEAWVKEGRKSIKNLLATTRGDDGAKYTNANIVHSLADSKIIIDAVQFKLVSGQRFFLLCPVRVHNNPHKEGGVTLCIVTSPNMTRYGLVVRSFKSCNNQYLWDVRIPMVPIFGADLIRARLATKLKVLCNMQGFTLNEAVFSQRDNNDDGNDDVENFMNAAATDDKWLAVARPEQYMVIHSIKYLYAYTSSVISYRYDNGDIVMIHTTEEPVGYVAKTVGPFREVRHMFDGDVFDRIINIMLNRDGQEE
jgi:hypothetical protein